MKNVTFSTLVAAILAGCATAPVKDTISGRNEVLIAAPMKIVRATLANTMIDKGYQVIADAPLLITFEKPAGIGYDLFFSTVGGPSAKMRLKFNLVEADKSVRVVGSSYLFSSAFSSHGSEEEWTKNSGEIQSFLEILRGMCEGEYAKQKVESEKKPGAE